MQVRKVAVAATGVLATAAAMGSTPAYADDAAASTEVAQSAVALGYESKHRASDEAMKEVAEQWLTVAPEQTTAPWDVEPPQILSVGSGSALNALSWQMCGSAGVWGVGVSAPVASPSTVQGDCNNGTVDIADGGGDALISILDGTAIDVASWQMCGSAGTGVLGLAAPIASPSTVQGDCNNGTITVGDGENGNGGYDGADDGMDEYPYHDSFAGTGGSAEAGGAEAGEAAAGSAEAGSAEAGSAEAGDAEAGVATAGNGEVTVETASTSADAEQAVVPGQAPWEQEPPQILSAGSGSALSVASWQMCGSAGVWGLGGSVPIASPSTVMGACDNGNIDIADGGGDALFSLLDGSAASAASWQMCASAGTGVLGASVPLASPSTVMDGCDNGNITIG